MVRGTVLRTAVCGLALSMNAGQDFCDHVALCKANGAFHCLEHVSPLGVCVGNAME
jgi:hypothetical protein